MGRSQVSFASRRFPRLLVALIIGVFVAAGQSALPASATPPPVDWGQWQAAGALLGPAPADAVVTAYLSLVVPAGLPEFALAVTDPSSPTYGKYKTLAQATEAFGASPETLTAVSAAVTKVGGRVDLGPVNTYAKATFTVAQADAFFSTTYGKYPGTGDYEFTVAPEVQPSLPASLSGLVDAVGGLVTGYGSVSGASAAHDPATPAVAAAGAGIPATPATPTRTGTPAGCSEGVASGGMTPNQLATAYGYDALHAAGVTGSGVKMAVLQLRHQVDPSEINSFANCYGLPQPHLRQVLVGPPGMQDESTLDVEVALQVAPDLDSLDLYSYNGGGFSQVIPPEWWIEMMALPVTPSVYGATPPDVVSVSYGACEVDWASNTPLVTMIDRMTSLAVTTGMSFFVSSGDSGSTGCLPNPELAIQYPSASPWVTAVGGTGWTLNQDNTIAAEAAWNDTLFAPPYGRTDGSGGGGTSRLIARPVWQSGDGVPAGAMRLTPDVSMFADFLPGVATSRGAVAGTSAASPMAAGIWALMTQLARASGRSVPGFAAPLLYALGRSSSPALRDVTAANNDILNAGCCDATPAWDLATGWGSLRGQELAQALYAPGPPTNLTSVSGYASAVINFTPPAPTLPITGFEYSIDGGATWHPTTQLGAGSVSVQGLPNGVAQQLRLRATTGAGVPGVASDSVAVSAPQGALFTPINPLVVYDSRNGDGPLYSGQNREVNLGVTGAALPGSVAVAYNLTATNTVGSGHLSVTPAGSATDTSAINWSGPGQIIANAAPVGVAGNRITVADQGGATDFLVSVVGYYAPVSVTPAAAVFTPMVPVRTYDSRNGDGPISTGQQRTINVTAGGLVPPTATAVAVNLTETDTQGRGHLSWAPDGQPPVASAINWWQAGQTIANSSVIGIHDGKIVVGARGGSADVILDVLGYFSAANDAPNGVRFTAITPTRAYDSRVLGAGGPLTSGNHRTTGMGNAAVPRGSAAYAFNLTVTQTVGRGHLRVAPGGALSGPLSSAINWTADGQKMANATVVGLHDNTMTTFARGGATQYLVDVLGYYN